MFTGLVQATGMVRSATSTPSGRRLEVDLGDWTHRPAEGDSIAIDGCCLTVAGPPEGSVVAFDAVPETLAKTTLGDLEAGDRVHLEHAVTASTLMGGHFVQGHVDGVGRVDEIRRGSDWRLIIAAPADLMPYFSPKGSVAVAGVSLTLAHVRPDDHLFELAIIPTTLELTKLGDLSPGSRVNIEADMLAKVAVQTVERTARALLAGSARGPTS
ncbi:MAG: riboflavin synthase [Planctomycetota bacterium]